LDNLLTLAPQIGQVTEQGEDSYLPAEVEGSLHKCVDAFYSEVAHSGNIFKGVDAAAMALPGGIINFAMGIYNHVQSVKQEGYVPLEKPSFIELLKEQFLSQPDVAKAIDGSGTMSAAVLKAAIRNLKLV